MKDVERCFVGSSKNHGAYYVVWKFIVTKVAIPLSLVLVSGPAIGYMYVAAAEKMLGIQVGVAETV